MVSFNGRAVFIRRSIFLIPNHASLVDIEMPLPGRALRNGIGINTERIEHAIGVGT